MTDLERELDRALSGKSHGQDVAPHAETAAQLRSAFAVEVPEGRAESLLFTHGVGLRKRSPLILRLLVPAVAVVSVIVALVLVGRNALPGESFYPVRGALKRVGLATAPIREVNREIRIARNLLISAEVAVLADPQQATDLAFEAVSHLRDASELLGDLDPPDRARSGVRINVLEQRAATLITQAEQARLDEIRSDDDSSGPGSGSDDDSGSGSDDLDGDDDSSGSGSSGSDDSDTDDDSSGSGSSGSGSDGDSSGSGSGDSDADDDSSGSGSSGSGSDGDSSGPG